MLHSPEGMECCLLLWKVNYSYRIQEKSRGFSSWKTMAMFHKDSLKGDILQFLEDLHKTAYKLLTKGHLAFVYSGQSEAALSMRLLVLARKQ